MEDLVFQNHLEVLVMEIILKNLNSNNNWKPYQLGETIISLLFKNSNNNNSNSSMNKYKGKKNLTMIGMQKRVETLTIWIKINKKH